MVDRFRAYTSTGEVGLAAPVSADGKAEFDAGLVVIATVVFYSGDEENESVAGSVLVNHSGPVSVALADEGVVAADGLAAGGGS